MVGPKPPPYLQTYAAVRLSSQPEDVDQHGIRNDAEWQHLLAVVSSLSEVTDNSKLHWFAAAAGDRKSDFMFYVAGKEIVEAWKGYLERSQQSRAPQLSLEPDVRQKWYEVLRTEAQQGGSDAEVITQWRELSSDETALVLVDFTLLFSSELQSQKARALVEEHWNGAAARMLLKNERWILTITVPARVSLPVISKLRRRAEGVARKFDGQFDGWCAALG